MKIKAKIPAIFMTISVVAILSLTVIMGSQYISADRTNKVDASNKVVAFGVDGNGKLPIKYTNSPIEAMYTDVSTIDAAMKGINFVPRIPKSPPGRSLEKVQLNKFPKEYRVVRFDYGDIIVLASPSNDASDYDVQAKENPDVMKKVNINGCPGIEIEHGQQDVPGFPGAKHDYPTVIGWYENGVKYTVYSKNLNLGEVRAFVQTMFK